MTASWGSDQTSLLRIKDTQPRDSDIKKLATEKDIGRHHSERQLISDTAPETPQSLRPCCHFTSLPPELRLNIYQHLIASSSSSLSNGEDQHHGHWPRVLLSRKLVLRELLPTWEACVDRIAERMDARWKESSKKGYITWSQDRQNWSEQGEMLFDVEKALTVEISWLKMAGRLLGGAERKGESVEKEYR